LFEVSDKYVNYLVSGQEVPVKILKAILRSGRIAHAYLLKGPAGSGKAALAREFAKGLLCLNQSRADDSFGTGDGIKLACNVCESCTRVDNHTHPDLLMIEKEGTSIRISASHSMIKEVLTRPYVSKRKVFIIDDAEALTAEAANALLKLLEEPPAHVNFILTTSNESAIPATVISRCQVIPLRALPAEAIAGYLHQIHNVPIELSREIAALSDGSVHKALWLLSQGDQEGVDGPALAGRIVGSSPVELAQEYSKADSQDRHRILVALELEFAQKLAKAAMEYNYGEHGAYGEHERPDAGGADALKTNFQALKAIMRARQRLGANANPFLVFCTLFMDIQRFITEEI
jgi:DNA polymerase III delta' subunit